MLDVESEETQIFEGGYLGDEKTLETKNAEDSTRRSRKKEIERMLK
jgi:hypothetical protein